MISFIVLFFYLLATIPAYYSEDECDLYADLTIRDELLQQDVIVKTFLEKYPKAIPLPAEVEESDPPQAHIKYEYENDDAKIEFQVYVREVGSDPNDCFVPAYYTYKYHDTTENLSVKYYYNQQQEALEFLNSFSTTRSL